MTVGTLHTTLSGNVRESQVVTSSSLGILSRYLAVGRAEKLKRMKKINNPVGSILGSFLHIPFLLKHFFVCDSLMEHTNDAWQVLWPVAHQCTLYTSETSLRLC